MAVREVGSITVPVEQAAWDAGKGTLWGLGMHVADFNDGDVAGSVASGMDGSVQVHVKFHRGATECSESFRVPLASIVEQVVAMVRAGRVLVKGRCDRCGRSTSTGVVAEGLAPVLCSDCTGEVGLAQGAEAVG